MNKNLLALWDIVSPYVDEGDIEGREELFSSLDEFLTELEG